MDLSIHCPSCVGAVKMDQQSTETISATQSNADHNGTEVVSVALEEKPLKFSHRIQGSMRTKILDLIKKKARKLPREMSVKESEPHFTQNISDDTVISLDEERSVCNGVHYSCPLCEMTFERKLSWIIHLDSQHNFTVESAAEMVKEIQQPSKTAIDSGTDTSAAGSDMSNDVMKLTAEDKLALVHLVHKQHKLTAHSKRHVLLLSSRKERIDRKCPFCPKFFKYSTNYDEHVLKHTDPKPYKCQQCANQYASKHAFVMHLQSHHEHPDVRVECEVCGKVFASDHRLDVHRSLKHSGVAAHCELCDVSFTSKHALKAHNKAEHVAQTAVCDTCGKTILTSSVESHMQQHGASNESIQCAQCDATFSLRTAYDRHCREQHDVDTVLTECGECGQKCCNRQALDKHMLRHTGKKSFTCAQCAAQFFTKGELEQHEGYHVDPNHRPWVCPTCRKSFTREFALKNHMLTHTTEKPFTCSICEKSFRWKNKLKEHVRVHTGEKPFKCRICDARFPDCAVRRHHEKKMHAEQIANDPDLIPKSHTRSSSSAAVKVSSGNNRTTASTKRKHVVAPPTSVENCVFEIDLQTLQSAAAEDVDVKEEKLTSVFSDGLITLDANINAIPVVQLASDQTATVTSQTPSYVVLASDQTPQTTEQYIVLPSGQATMTSNSSDEYMVLPGDQTTMTSQTAEEYVVLDQVTIDNTFPVL